MQSYIELSWLHFKEDTVIEYKVLMHNTYSLAFLSFSSLRSSCALHKVIETNTLMHYKTDN